VRPDVTFRVLDGGDATVSTRQGLDLSDDLWSARVRLEAPALVRLLGVGLERSPSSWS